MDADKKEPMKKAKGKAKTKTNEGAEEEATLVMASKDMVDRITGWMEDTAEMQTESMLELADKIRDEMGVEKSEEFTGSVKPALESLYSALESTRDSLTTGVAILTGEGAPTTMGDEAANSSPAGSSASVSSMSMSVVGSISMSSSGTSSPIVVGAEQFNRDSFVEAFNSDTRVRNLVNNFDEAGVTLKGGQEPKQEPEDKTVDKMADRATANALK